MDLYIIKKLFYQLDEVLRKIEILDKNIKESSWMKIITPESGEFNLNYEEKKILKEYYEQEKSSIEELIVKKQKQQINEFILKCIDQEISECDESISYLNKKEIGKTDIDSFVALEKMKDNKGLLNRLKSKIENYKFDE